MRVSCVELGTRKWERWMLCALEADSQLFIFRFNTFA